MSADLHGAMGNCPRCDSDKAIQLKRLDSDKIDYHVDIFRCDKCGAYLVSSCWGEHSDLIDYDSLAEALEDAEERIEIQEEAILR